VVSTLIGADIESTIFCDVPAEGAEWKDSPAHEVIAKIRMLPKNRKYFNFIFLFPLQYST
jgi:hypothetical protein